MLESLHSINEIRQEVGLRPIVWKKVKCLGCGKEFESHDYPRQRMCIVCRRHTDDTTPVQDFMLTG
jgi:formylmethanofuran dehydrogenase subunit E